MRVPIVIEAQMGATTATGAALRQVAGKPVLGYLLDSLEHALSAREIIVITSNETADDPVQDYCLNRGVRCRRGPADDLAATYKLLLAEAPVDGFVRLSQVSPLLDHRLVDRAVELFSRDMPDLVTNRQPASFPAGEMVEVIGAEALKRVLGDMTDPADRADPAGPIYQNPGRFQVVAFRAPRDLSSLRLAVETEQDFATFVSTVMRMTRPHWSYTYEDSLALATGILA